MAQVKPKQSKQGKQASGPKKVNEEEGETKIETSKKRKHHFKQISNCDLTHLPSLSLFVDRTGEEQRTTEKE